MCVEFVRNLVAHGDAREGKWRGNWRMEWVTSTLTAPPNVVYPALLKLIRTPRVPAVDWTDFPTDLNGLVRLGERRNVVSARVPSGSARALTLCYTNNGDASNEDLLKDCVPLLCAYLCTHDSTHRLCFRWVVSNSLGFLDTFVARIPLAFSVTNKQTNKYKIKYTSSCDANYTAWRHERRHKAVTNWCQTRRWLSTGFALTSQDKFFHPSYVNWARFEQLRLGNHSELDKC